MLCLRLPSFPSAFGFRKQNALEWWNVAAQASQREEPLLSGDLQHNYDSWKSGPVPTCAYWFNTMVRMTEAPLSPVYESGGSGGMSSLAISYAVFSSARMPTLTGGRAWLPLCVAFSPQSEELSLEQSTFIVKARDNCDQCWRFQCRRSYPELWCCHCTLISFP